MANLQDLLDRYYDTSKVSTARRGAMTAYVYSEGPGAVGMCVEALDDPEPAIRKQALRLLGEMKDAAAVEPLTRRLEGADTEMQRRILTTLGQIGHESARPTIERFAESDDFFLRSSARRAMRDLDEPPIAAAPTARKPLDIDLLGEPPAKIATPSADETSTPETRNDQGPATLDPSAFRRFSVNDIELQEKVRQAEAAARLGRRRERAEAAPRPKPSRKRTRSRRAKRRQVQAPPPPPATDADGTVDVQLGPSRPLPGGATPVPIPPRPKPKAQAVERLEPVRVDDAYQAYLARRKAAAQPRQRTPRIPVPSPRYNPRNPRKKNNAVISFVVFVVLAVGMFVCSGLWGALFS